MKKFAVLILLICGWCSAAKSNEQILVLTEHLPPFQIVTDKGIEGFATEMVRESFNNAGLDYQIKAQPWSTVYKSVLREPNTCVYSIVKSSQREHLFQWIGELHNVSPAFYAFEGSQIQLASINHAKQYQTVIIKDDIAHDFLVQKGFEINKHFYATETTDSQWKLLASPSRQLDMVITNQVVTHYRNNQNKNLPQLKKLLDLNELQQSFQLACNLKMQPEVLQKLKRALQKVDKQRILAKHSIVND